MNRLVVLLSMLAVSYISMLSNVYAHAPELHKKESAHKPKCEAMRNMDLSKMDANDPIMLALIKQCAGKNHNESHHENGHHTDKTKKKS